MIKSNLSGLLLVSLVAMLFAGCNPGGSAGGSASEGSGSTSEPPAAPQLRVDDSQFLARAAHVAEGEGQLTLNNPWTVADAAGNDMDYVDWQNTPANFRWQGTTYTTLVTQYRERRKQCERDSQVTYRQRYPEFDWTGSHPDFPICHPTLSNRTFEADEDDNPIDCFSVVIATVAPPGPRYGYWCGAGHPPFGAHDSIAPQPLDAVDFCCMLHDAQVWGKTDAFTTVITLPGIGDVPFNTPTERGMSMCLRMATQYPAGTMGKLQDVEESRQFWYGCTGWAISGNQQNQAPPPAVRR